VQHVISNGQLTEEMLLIDASMAYVGSLAKKLHIFKDCTFATVSADQGDTNGSLSDGVCLLNGKDVPTDLNNAAH
jgi:hypothetical protein